MKFNTVSETTTTTSSSVPIPTITDTKARRLLNTIDKLHQIQNATKLGTIPKMSLETEPIKADEDGHKSALCPSPMIDDHPSDNSFQISQSFTIDHPTTPKDSQSIRKKLIQ